MLTARTVSMGNARGALKERGNDVYETNFLESEKRSDLIDGGQLARVHVFANRLPCMHRQGWTGPRTSSTTAFVWQRGHRDRSH